MKSKSKLRLWYKKPAEHWEMEALPIGNAHLGGMIFGGIIEEKVQYNEKTLWSGGPGIGEAYTFGNRKDAYKKLGDIREIVFEGRGHELTREQKNAFAGMEVGFGNFQSFGEILLNSKCFEGKRITNYSRELDLEESYCKS